MTWCSNSYRPPFSGSCGTTHAEVGAVKKLKPRDKTKKPICVDLLVIRINKSGGLTMSKPCFFCTKKLSSLVGYKIRKIYYSDAKGNIVRETFSVFLKSGSCYKKTKR
jgi:hypothetical protein